MKGKAVGWDSPAPQRASWAKFESFTAMPGSVGRARRFAPPINRQNYSLRCALRNHANPDLGFFIEPRA